jgi:hypothetical protein
MSAADRNIERHLSPTQTGSAWNRYGWSSEVNDLNGSTADVSRNLDNIAEGGLGWGINNAIASQRIQAPSFGPGRRVGALTTPPSKSTQYHR